MNQKQFFFVKIRFVCLWMNASWSCQAVMWMWRFLTTIFDLKISTNCHSFYDVLLYYKSFTWHFFPGDTTYIADNEISSILCSLLNYTVIITCIVSLVLCSRTVWRAQQLKRVTIMFFKCNFDKQLGVTDRNKFLNWWYIMIIVNDVLIIMGSAIKEEIERQEFTSDQWNVCSMFLGVGNMLVWFGILRYLGFFQTYNIVIVTLQKAAPQVSF